jgi:hypothetical protein
MTTQQQQPAVQHPGAASALAIVGGALMIVSGLLILAVSVFVVPAISTYIGQNVHFVYSGSSTTGYIYNGTLHTFNGSFPFQPSAIPGMVSGITELVGIFGLVSGVIVLLSGAMLYTNPASRSIWGILIIVFSVLSFFGFGGFIIGAILGIIGGVMALRWKPSVPTM